MKKYAYHNSITLQTKASKKVKPQHKYIGVSYHTRSGKFDANAWNRSKNRQEFLGSFDSPEMGAIARDLFVYHLHTNEKQVGVNTEKPAYFLFWRS